MKSIAKIMAAGIAAAFAVSAAYAQAPSNTAPPKRHGLLGLFHHPKPGGTPAANGVRKPLFAGNIIGNKNTRVYHMPGDRGALPAPKNRVYFRTEAQAMAAGFRRAGAGGAHHGAGHMMGHTGAHMGGHMSTMHH